MSGCGGWVRSLKGRQVTFAGLVYLNGKRYTHRECSGLVESRGGCWSLAFSSEIDLVVRGYRGSSNGEGTGAGRKIELARRSNLEDSKQRHVHVVNSSAFSSLLNHHGAACINQPLEGRSGDWVQAMTADGRRRRIEGRFGLVVDDRTGFVVPTVLLGKNRHEVFPNSVHVLKRRSSRGTMRADQGSGELQDAAAKNLIRAFGESWAQRYDISWEGMFDQLATLIEPLLAAGWSQAESGFERGGWDEEDFVFASLERNDISIDIEVAESGCVSSWEELLLEERSDEDVERSELTNPRSFPEFGRADDLKGVTRWYRHKRWIF